MDINNLLYLFPFIPFIGFIFVVFAKNDQENLIYNTTIAVIFLHALFGAIVTSLWVTHDFHPIHLQAIKLYETNSSHFYIEFYYDKFTMVYGVMATILTFSVAKFSKYYIHREKGFRRFFSNLLFFYGGINVIIYSGNFETMFIGWEIIGIASFFLISFYKDRYLPVKNALKVVSYYRFADIFFLLGIWACHHSLGHSLSFYKLEEIMQNLNQIYDRDLFLIFVPLSFMVVAFVKSAIFPFSSWLPRAMEGPTTSSAIFYGSLSIHIGIFLLLRISPIWQDNIWFKIILILFGLVTCLVATLISNVQSSVKTQIAYSSIAQIGLMLVWLALGWHTVALIHFISNAFLRTYQLLVSPSVLSYLIHDQFFNFKKPLINFESNFIGKVRLSLYMWAIKEFNMDWFMYEYFWQPLKKIGKLVTLIPQKALMFIILSVYAIGLYGVYNKAIIPQSIIPYFPVTLSILSMVIGLRAFVERESPIFALLLVIFNQLFISVAIGFNEQFDFNQVHLFLSGIFLCGVLGLWVLYQVKSKMGNNSMQIFNGYYRYLPMYEAIFIVALLGLTGFPITPTFIGEDLILGHIHKNQYLLTALITGGLLVDSLAIFRIYARVFLGPSKVTNNEAAYRSS